MPTPACPASCPWATTECRSPTRGEVSGQVKAGAHVHGQQRRQVPVLLHALQFLQAGGDGRVGVGGVAEALEHGVQRVGADMLRAAVGVDPIHRQARTAGEYFQLRFAQECSPTDDEVSPGVRLTRAEKGVSDLRSLLVLNSSRRPAV